MTKKELLIGATAGVFAAWTMSEFQRTWLRMAGEQKAPEPRRSARPRTDQEVMMKVAEDLLQATTGYRLSDKQKRVIGPLLHYSFGAVAGAAYGGMAKKRLVRTAYGAGFGTVLFGILEALGPSEYKPRVPPKNQRAVSELYEWLAHLVYGVSLEGGRRLLSQRM